MSDRIRKVNSLLKELVSEVLLRELSGENLVTVTAIETERAMKTAVVWISIMGDEKAVLAEINAKKSEIQHAVTSQMFSKYTPLLEFKVDHSQEKVQRIEELLSGEKD